MEFADAMANGGRAKNGYQVLSTATIDLMRRNFLSPIQMQDFSWSQLAGYGYGLGVRTMIDPCAAGSNGSIGEFGWPRTKGNTATMADIFAKGAIENHNAVTEIVLKDKTIIDCSGCAICQQNGGKCVQDDDMNEIYDEMYKADVIVLACPVYFYTWPSLMKRMIDRTFAIEDSMDKKIFYLLGAAATRKEINVQTMIKCFRQYISCFGENESEDGSIIFAYDTRKTENVKK